MSKWKSVSGCVTYVGGAEVPLYPVETVNRVELGPVSVKKVPFRVRGDPKCSWILVSGLPKCMVFHAKCYNGAK